MPVTSGQSIGRYTISEVIGQGGMATVYRAYDTRLERDVAIKVIRKDLFGETLLERMLKRFEREARVLARLEYLHIVQMLDYGDYDGAPYLVMQYLPGGTLKSRLGQPWDWRKAVRFLLPVAQALEYAHARGVLHRDVKPANILLTEQGQPLLSDFGIAKLLEGEETATLTGTATGIGTPEYMAPEQGMGQPVDGRADVYSLGIILYEMLTGCKPYTADTPIAVILKHVTESLPRPRALAPGIPAPVERVLLKALEKKPEDRYDSMARFAGALEGLLEAPQEKPRLQRAASDQDRSAPASEPRARPDQGSDQNGMEAGTFDEVGVRPVTGQTSQPARPVHNIIPIRAILVVGLVMGGAAILFALKGPDRLASSNPPAATQTGVLEVPSQATPTLRIPQTGAPEVARRATPTLRTTLSGVVSTPTETPPAAPSAIPPTPTTAAAQTQAAPFDPDKIIYLIAKTGQDNSYQAEVLDLATSRVSPLFSKKCISFYCYSSESLLDVPADAKTILYTNSTKNLDSFYQYDLATRESRLVLSAEDFYRQTGVDAYFMEFHVSPDGQKIALGLQSGLYLVDIQAQTAQKLTNLRWVLPRYSQAGLFRWSPDSQTIAYVCQSKICLVGADGSGSQFLNLLGNINSPAWSPDGQKLAYISDHIGCEQIYTVDLQAGQSTSVFAEMPLPCNPRQISFGKPAWSPDGSRVAYRFGSGVVIQTVASGEKISLSGYPDDYAWIAGGAQLAVLSNGSLRIYDADGNIQSAHELGNVYKIAVPAATHPTPRVEP